MEFDGKPFVPHPSGRLLTPYTLDMEREFQQVRSELARQYGVAQPAQPGRPSRTADDWIGIAASGHTYHELREALGLLGLDRRRRRCAAPASACSSCSMPVPLDEEQVRDFAHGLAEVLVVEEKNPTLELLVKARCTTSAERPRVVGRHDEHGRPARCPGTGMLDADRLLEPLRRRLAARLGDDAPAPAAARRAERVAHPADGQPHAVLLQRLPAQHLDPGARGDARRRRHRLPRDGRPDGAGAGRRHRRAHGDGQRGRPVDRHGAVRRARPPRPEPRRRHVLPLRARWPSGPPCAAGVDITYKLLYNGTVAMTGGQDPQGQMSRARRRAGRCCSRASSGSSSRPRTRASGDDADFGAAHADGRRRRCATAPMLIEARSSWPTVAGRHGARPRPARARPRSAATAAAGIDRQAGLPRRHQRAGVRGLRRLRRQEQLPVGAAGRHAVRPQDPDPPDELQLRHDVPAGRLPVVRHRRRVDAERPPRRRRPDRPGTTGDPGAGLPDPVADRADRRVHVRLSGIGGTGVITVSQVLGTAAMLDGYVVRGLDQTGLSQKAGPGGQRRAVSAAATCRRRTTPTASGVDCLLAFDLLVAASDTHRVGADAGRARSSIGSVAADADRRDGRRTRRRRTPSSTRSPAAWPRCREPELQPLRRRRRRSPPGCSATRRRPTSSCSASPCRPAPSPVDPAHIERAIELNGVAVERNIAAFRWGRRWAVDPDEVEQAAGYVAVAPTPRRSTS